MTPNGGRNHVLKTQGLHGEVSQEHKYREPLNFWVLPCLNVSVIGAAAQQCGRHALPRSTRAALETVDLAHFRG